MNDGQAICQSSLSREACRRKDYTPEKGSAIAKSYSDDSVSPQFRKRSARQILLVDDDLGTLETLGIALRLAAFQVTTCVCGATALESIQRHEFHGIICDLKLPDISGLDILRKLRHANFTTPVIVISGFGTIACVRDALQLGAADFLEKPVSSEYLIKVLTAALEETHNTSIELPVVDRWANAVLTASEMNRDPKNLACWAHAVPTSVSQLRTLCYMVLHSPDSPRRSLQFARLLRAIVRSNSCGVKPEDLLDVSDPRTLARLLREIPNLALASANHAGIPDFIDSQRIVLDPKACAAVKRRMKECRKQ